MYCNGKKVKTTVYVYCRNFYYLSEFNEKLNFQNVRQENSFHVSINKTFRLYIHMSNFPVMNFQNFCLHIDFTRVNEKSIYLGRV